WTTFSTLSIAVLLVYRGCRPAGHVRPRPSGPVRPRPAPPVRPRPAPPVRPRPAPSGPPVRPRPAPPVRPPRPSSRSRLTEPRDVELGDQVRTGRPPAHDRGPERVREPVGPAQAQPGHAVTDEHRCRGEEEPVDD